MKFTMMKGLAITLMAGAMSIGDAQAIGWPEPATQCTEANAFQTEDVYYYGRRQQLKITYVCEPGYGWWVLYVCDLSPGGFCSIYPGPY